MIALDTIELAKRRRRRLEKEVLDEVFSVVAVYRHRGYPDLEDLTKAFDRLQVHLEVYSEAGR